MADLIRPGDPPVPASPESSVLARRPELAAEVERYARAAEAEATRRAHAADWHVFEAWCAAHGVAALPATVDTLAGFVADVAAFKATATVLRYVGTIGKMHKRVGLPSPAADPRMKEVLRGVRRAKGTANPRAKEPMTGALLSQWTAGLARLAREHEELRQALRDQAILFVGHATALRRAELCAIDCEDLSWTDLGVTILVRRSKTDQEGKGRSVVIPRLDDRPLLCTVRALRAWLDDAGIISGPVFRGLVKGGGVRSARLTPGQVSVIVKRTALSLGLDPKLFGGHSLRAGYVTDGRAAGKDWTAIMDQTGHRKIETVRRYARGDDEAARSTEVRGVLNAAFGDRPSSAQAWEDLAEGDVKIRRVGLPPPMIDPSCFEGKEEHRRLCASAAAWLDREGRGWQIENRRYPWGSPGGLADLVSRDGKLFVEAGNTDLDKVVQALRDGCEVLLVPFAFAGVVGFHVAGSVPDNAERLARATAALDAVFQPQK